MLKKKVMAMLLVSVMVCSLAACGSSSSSSSDSDEDSASSSSEESTSDDESSSDSSTEKWVIGYSNKDDTDPFLKEIEDEFQKLIDADDSLECVFANADKDAQTQLDQLNNFLVQDVNAVVIVPQEGDAVVDFIEECNDTGIVPFCVSQAAGGGDYTFVGVSDIDLGTMIAEWAYENLPENAKVLYLGGELGYQTSVDRRQALVDGLGDRLYADWDGNVLNEDGDIEILSWQECDYTMEDGMTITEDWIQTFDDFDAIIACNDNSALGAMEALSGAGITDVMVMGIDGLADAVQAIHDGTYSATAAQSATSQAQALYDAIINARDGGENDAIIYTDVYVIDSTNCDEYLD